MAGALRSMAILSIGKLELVSFRLAVAARPFRAMLLQVVNERPHRWCDALV